MLVLFSCPPHRAVLRLRQENMEFLESSGSGKGLLEEAGSALQCVGGLVCHHIPASGWACVGQGRGLALTAEQEL